MKFWSLCAMILLSSLSRVGQAEENFKPVLTVHPNVSPVFRGQTVTLTCTDSGEGGSYIWYKDSVSFNSSAKNVYTIKVDQSHTYSCYVSYGGRSTMESDGVTLSVIERPKAVVTLQPDGEVFAGEKVTLTCEIRGDAEIEWLYNWYKDGVQLFASVEINKYSVSPKESFSSEFSCSGVRKSDSQSSETSAAVPLTVSDKPKKPKLTSNRIEGVLTGNSATLTCTLTPQSAGWKFYWIKAPQSVETETETNSYTMGSVQVSDGGQYRCRAGKGNPVYYTDYSDALWLKVTARPKAVLSVKPDHHVFRGETVTFRCEIRGGGGGGGDTEWTYRWDDNTYRSNTNHNTQEFSLRSVGNEDRGKYRCMGVRKSDSLSSGWSDDVTLSVSDEAKAVMSVSPLSWLTEGDSVTLSCEVKHSSTGWTFSWYTHYPYRNQWGSLSSRTELLSDSSRGSGGSYTLSAVTPNHTGVYECRAQRGEKVFPSNQQPLWITGESPPISLIINPNRTQHFTTDSLSLSCGDQSQSTGWIVRGHTHSALWDCSSFSVSTCTIGFLSTSHTGVYWCQSESGGCSNPINITVNIGLVILDSPVNPVTEGHPLTLRCLYRSKTTSRSGIDFYKDASVLQINTTGEMTISSVSKSHEGFYYCKHPQKGESPKSWVSVSLTRKGPGFDIAVVAGALGLVLALLFVIISVILLWRHKSNKEKNKDQLQKSDHLQEAEDSGKGDTALQTDDAESSNVTYAELELKPQNESRKNQVKLDPDTETVYSALKQSA